MRPFVNFSLSFPQNRVSGALRVGCVFRTVTPGPVGGASRPLESLWADVRARVAAGDHIVMTSEVAVATSNQTSLLETVAAIAAGGDSYVGIGFDARVDGGGDAQAPEDAVVEGRRGAHAAQT